MPRGKLHVDHEEGRAERSRRESANQSPDAAGATAHRRQLFAREGLAAGLPAAELGGLLWRGWVVRLHDRSHQVVGLHVRQCPPRVSELAGATLRAC